VAGYDYVGPDVQDYLAAQLALDSQLSEVPVCVGYPAGGLQSRHVWIRGDMDLTFPRRTSGGRVRDEDGAVTVRVWIEKTSDSTVDVRDEAAAIAKRVEVVVAADPTFGGLVKDGHVASAKGQEGVAGNVKRQYGIELTVRYQTSVAQ